MIYLKFIIAEQCYGLEHRDIVEIVPRVALEQLTGAPDYIPGFFNYRGRVVPVVDLAMLLTGKPSQPVISSRITVIRYEEKHLLGILLERATDIITDADGSVEWQRVGVKTECDYLGNVSLNEDKPLQLVNAAKLLPDAVKKIIFKD